MSSRNEAAERLNIGKRADRLLESLGLDPDDQERYEAAFDLLYETAGLAALGERASERAATVERIRMEIRLSAFHANNPKLTKGWEELYQILDAELAR